MLSKTKLENGLKEAFEKGISMSSLDEKSSESVHSRSEVAGFIADAIVNYAADAEIQLFPGPFIFPNPVLMVNPAAVPPILFDLAAPLFTAKCPTAKAGKAAIETAIASSFEAEDPTMSALTAALPVYAATFVTYQSSRSDIASGATIMAVPPIFAADLLKGMNGSEMNPIASAMAATIHTSFTSCTFAGVGFTVTIGGVGPISSILF